MGTKGDELDATLDRVERRLLACYGAYGAVPVRARGVFVEGFSERGGPDGTWRARAARNPLTGNLEFLRGQVEDGYVAHELLHDMSARRRGIVLSETERGLNEGLTEYLAGQAMHTPDDKHGYMTLQPILRALRARVGLPTLARAYFYWQFDEVVRRLRMGEGSVREVDNYCSRLIAGVDAEKTPGIASLLSQ